MDLKLRKTQKMELKLSRMSEGFIAVIDSDNEYVESKIKEYLKVKRQLETQRNKDRKDDDKEYDKRQEEIARKREYVPDEMRYDIDRFKEKREKLNKKIAMLEYRREESLQNLNLAELRKQQLEAEPDEKESKELKAYMRREDKDLAKINAKLAFAILRKTIRDSRQLSRIRTEIQRYNDTAFEIGFSPINLEQFMEENSTKAQLLSIRKQMQGEYVLDQYASAEVAEKVGDSSRYENLPYIMLVGDVSRRKEIEENSEKRMGKVKKEIKQQDEERE